ISTLETNETTKTLSSKMPSRNARSAPKTASRAATTAIGRYGSSHTGTSGCSSSPARTPSSSPTAAIIGRSPEPLGLVCEAQGGSLRRGQLHGLLGGDVELQAKGGL